MKIKLIGCEVLKNELLWLGARDIAHCDFLAFDLHSNVDKLHEAIQKAIDQSQDYERIILGYGRCSNVLLGIHSAHTQLVFPTVHDCVGLTLGSNGRHLDCINKNPGTFYFTQGFLDYGENPYKSAMKYMDTYGEKKGHKIIKAMYGGYKRGLFIKTPGIENDESYNTYLEQAAFISKYFGWRLDKADGDPGLMNALLRGEDNKEVVRIEKGQTITTDLFD